MPKDYEEGYRTVAEDVQRLIDDQWDVNWMMWNPWTIDELDFVAPPSWPGWELAALPCPFRSRTWAASLWKQGFVYRLSGGFAFWFCPYEGKEKERWLHGFVTAEWSAEVQQETWDLLDGPVSIPPDEPVLMNRWEHDTLRVGATLGHWRRKYDRASSSWVYFMLHRLP